jgi:hypothetical protein
MVRYLYKRISINMWMPSIKTGGSTNSIVPSCHGVLLRQSRGVYFSHPAEVREDLLTTIQKINAAVAFTMSSQTTEVIFSTLVSAQNELILRDGSQYQIVESMADISRGASSSIKKFQYTCLVKKEQVVLLWHDDREKILQHAQEVERKLLALVH